MLDEYKSKEWHIWDFPDEVRICFSDEFREYLFKTLKKVCGSRYGLSKILELHPMTVKEYELGKSSHDRPVFISVFVLKKLIEILRKSSASLLIDEVEKHIVEMRLEGGRSLIVYDPILPIKESVQLYSFAAHMIGDGCASKEGVPFYCGTDRELIELFKKDLRIFGKIETKEFTRKDGVIYISYPTVIARIVQHLLRVRFTKPDEIPVRLFETRDEYKIVFIRSFYDDEGSVTIGKIYLTQKSKRILEQIKSLLKPLGIETSKIYHKEKTGAHQFIILTHSYEKFHSLIGFQHSKRKKRLEELILKRHSKPIPIKHRVLDLLKKSHPLTKYSIASSLDLRIESIHEALSSLKEEGEISYHYANSRKPALWYPKVSDV